MDKTNQYSLFHPNYFVSKKEQIKLEQLMQLSNPKTKTQIFKSNKLKVWRNGNKTKKKIVPQDSKYAFKQIVKGFKLNKEQFIHGYSKKYINLFTDLLYKKNMKKYAKKRLFLVDFRKKILKNKLNTSFEEFIQKEPLSDRYNFSKQNLNNIYLTTVIHKQKSNYSSTKNIKKPKNDSKINNNRILLKQLSSQSNINFNQIKLGLNSENRSNSNKNEKFITSNDNIKQNLKIYNKINDKNLYCSKNYNTNFSELNILFPYNHIEEKIINNYTSRKDENKYFEKLTPKEEFIESRNKVKYINYLKNKYNFYTYGTIKDLKNYTEIKNRQEKFNSYKNKIEQPLDYPYKKEFFKRYNLINSKSNTKLLINEEIKNKDEHIKNLFSKRNKEKNNKHLFPKLSLSDLKK